MPVLCAVCETDNPADVSECVECGRTLAAAGSDDGAVGALAGIERTLADPVAVETSAIAGLEPTALAGRDVAVEDQRVAALEPTQLDADPAARSNWTTAVELDSGREMDLEPRTPAPAESAACPYCGTASLGAVCDGCGRRKARFAGPRALAGIAASGETRLCPACFARVPASARCEECGVPFPLAEL